MSTEPKLYFYMSSISSSQEIKKKQTKIQNILESKKIDFEQVDIAASSDCKDKMRKMCNDPKALPPQLFRGDKHLGDFEAFENAVEDERISDFLS